jgi:hypothetical protein
MYFVYPLLISLIYDNCQLFYVVISTYNQLVFDQFESAFYSMKLMNKRPESNLNHTCILFIPFGINVSIGMQ